MHCPTTTVGSQHLRAKNKGAVNSAPLSGGEMITNRVIRVCANCSRRSNDIHETICIHCGFVTQEEKQVVTKSGIYGKDANKLK